MDRPTLPATFDPTRPRRPAPRRPCDRKGPLEGAGCGTMATTTTVSEPVARSGGGFGYGWLSCPRGDGTKERVPLPVSVFGTSGLVGKGYFLIRTEGDADI